MGKTVLIAEAIPRDWSGLAGMDRCLLEKDIAITKSRLRLKLLVFKTGRDLRRFWNKGLRHLGYGNRLDRGVAAVSQSLCYDVVDFSVDPSRRRTERDEVYYGVIAFSADELKLEYVLHECVHAAIYYRERVGRKNAWKKLDEDGNDEMLCYPAGRLAAVTCSYMQKAGIKVSLC